MGVIIRNGIEYSGALSGGGSCDHKIVYLTQEEYDALPGSKYSDNVEYRITDANTHVNAARDWAYDNSNSDLDAETVQDAIDELDDGLGTLNKNLKNEDNETFNFGIKDGVRGFFTDPSRADDSFVPFSRLKTGTFMSSTNGVTIDLGFQPKFVTVYASLHSETHYYYDFYCNGISRGVRVSSSSYAVHSNYLTISENGFTHKVQTTNYEKESYYVAY